MDTSEDVTWVRLLIADPDADGDEIFDADDLALLIRRAGHPLLGAADALDSIAASEVLLSKKITTQDLSTDGPAVAAELRKQAEGLRARWRRERDEQAYDEATDWGLAVFSLSGQRHAPEATERGCW